MRGAVAGLEEDALGAVDDLIGLAAGAGVLDEEGLQPGGQKEPLDVRLGGADEGADEEPCALDIEPVVFALVGGEAVRAVVDEARCADGAAVRGEGVEDEVGASRPFLWERCRGRSRRAGWTCRR
ncbi:MAG: hypothetical protein R3B70_15245 [Polyangiaceae bacterium]